MAAAWPIDVPYAVQPVVVTSEGTASFVLPTGPFANGGVPGMRLEGLLEQRAWHVEEDGRSTLDLLSPLRASLQVAGFSLIFECDDDECGGFDFRYALPVIPEPEMHVNRGDFRFVSAIRKGEGVTILVSKSADAGFVQISHLYGAAGGKTPGPETAPPKAKEPPLITSSLAAALEAEGRAALEDLEFASGSAALSDGAYSSLQELAEWLRANPARRIALVGHTDAAGSLEANTSLSKRRAESVEQRLVSDFKVSSAQIDALGVGYLSPRATNQTEEGRRKNRRVEAVVTSTPSSQ